MTFVTSGAEDRRSYSPTSSAEMTPRIVLVVTADESLRSSMAETLGARGYKVLTAATFAEGRKLLIDWQPDALVTTIRLQDHNGLHLAIVSRLSSVLTKTIVIGYADPVLQADAKQAGALYLTNPQIDDVTAAVENAVHRRERRWPRARANFTARAADQIVRLVDLSYGGFRIELAPGVAFPAGSSFDLTVGDLRIAALPVWMKQQSASDHLWCGATVSENGDSYLAWRELVDHAMSHVIQ